MADSLANSRQAGASEIAKFIEFGFAAYLEAPTGLTETDPLTLAELAAWMADKIVRCDLSPPR